MEEGILETFLRVTGEQCQRMRVSHFQYALQLANKNQQSTYQKSPRRNDYVMIKKEKRSTTKTCNSGNGIEYQRELNSTENRELAVAKQSTLKAQSGAQFLRTFAHCKNVQQGTRSHSNTLELGQLGENVLVGSNLIHMYVKCGALSTAKEMFDNFSVRDVVSWNTLIAGHQHHGLLSESLIFFNAMQCEGILPDAGTFISSLKAYGSLGIAGKAQELHARIIADGILKSNSLVQNTLIDMYAKWGLLGNAKQVFDGMQTQDVVSWTSLIGGYIQHGNVEGALKYFDKMQIQNIYPNAVTFSCVLKACGSIGAFKKGLEIHVNIIGKGLLEKDVVVGNALVDMFIKCCLVKRAENVFDVLSLRDVVSWNVLITGYVQHGYFQEALRCFQQMHCEGFFPNFVTIISILKAFSILGFVKNGEQVYAGVVPERFVERDFSVGSAMVDLYAKCGYIGKAKELFDQLPMKNVVAWNALMTGCIQYARPEEALKYFQVMLLKGTSPNAVTFICALKACGSLGCACMGQEIHVKIIQDGMQEFVKTALVEMYANCGMTKDAQHVFDEIPFQDSVSWSILMAGYSLTGNDETVSNLLYKLADKGQSVDSIMFTITLNSCSHSGQLDKGQLYFYCMDTCFGIIPTIQHYKCMVDLFGRTGNLERALIVIKGMPYSADLSVWHIVLGGCQKWGDVMLGRLAFEHAVQLNEKDAISYRCLSNIYAAAGMQQDAEKIEAMRVKNGAWKTSPPIDGSISQDMEECSGCVY